MAQDLAVEAMQSMADLNSATPPHICAVFFANSAPSALRGRSRLHTATVRLARHV